MKNYFVIEVGSRGIIESFKFLWIEDIVEYLNDKKRENSSDGESEFEDLYGWSEVEGGYVLGVGDECEIYYVDVESDVYVSWIEEREVDGELVDNDIMDLIDRVN